MSTSRRAPTQPCLGGLRAARGAGPLCEEIIRWCARRSLASQLDLADQVPSAEMPACLNGLDLLVLPSLSRPNWQEQFGRVLVEAMACEVPVISSNAGGLSEVNIHGVTGYLQDPGDVDGMAAHAIELLENPDLLARFRKQAYEQARRFRIEQILPEYEALYEKVLLGVNV